MIVYVATAGDSDGTLSTGVFSTYALAREWLDQEISRHKWYSWGNVWPMKVDDPDHEE